MEQENKENGSQTQQKIAMRVSGVSITVTVYLINFLQVFGSFRAVLSEQYILHLSDSTIVVIIGVKLSGKKSDAEHQYGHERLECVSAIILAGLLFATGVGIGMSGIKSILAGSKGQKIMEPGLLALIAAVVSIVTKEWMFWYTRAAAKKISSGALMADAWHHRSDALSSVGSFVGILGARLGCPIMDPIASVVICIFILKAAIDIFKDAIDRMVDHSCDEETEDKMRQAVLEVPGVKGVDVLQTRLFGSKIYVDLEISADGQQSLNDAHAIAERVHHMIENTFQDVKHCMVHVNPYTGK